MTHQDDYPQDPKDPEIQQYQEGLHLYGMMILDLAESEYYIKLLIKGHSLPAIDQALKNHIKQFIEEEGE